MNRKYLRSILYATVLICTISACQPQNHETHKTAMVDDIPFPNATNYDNNYLKSNFWRLTLQFCWA